MISMMVKIGLDNKFMYGGAEYSVPEGWAGRSIQAHDLGDYILLMIGAGRAYHKQVVVNKPADVTNVTNLEQDLSKVTSPDVKVDTAPKKKGRPKSKGIDKSK